MSTPTDDRDKGGRRDANSSTPVKRASALAQRIQAEIMRRRWPVGESLGVEVDLIERYEVSRSVLREAIRLLESRWVARMRPGPGGGLLVTAPDSGAVSEVTRLCLDYQGVQPEHLYQVWLALELTAVATLSDIIDEEGAARLRDLLTEEQQTLEDDPSRAIDLWMDRGINLHKEIARQTRNPALELFVSVVVDLALEYHTELAEPEVAAHWLHTSHTGIVEAIVSGDSSLAQLRLRRYMHGLMRGGGMGPIEGGQAPEEAPPGLLAGAAD